MAGEDGPIVIDHAANPPRRMPYGDDMRAIIGEDAVGGAFSLHHRTAPPGAASFPHSHKKAIEAFYVIDGEFEFEIGGRKFTAGAGMYVQAPKGVSHAWKVLGGKTAHALVFFSPSVAPAFFDEVDAEVRTGNPDRDKLYAINAKYGLD
ncbi:MAG: cupin domain-containing protein [Chloroflexota bacterium]